MIKRFVMTEERLNRSARMWNAGKGTLFISGKLGCREATLYKHIEKIKTRAQEMRQGLHPSMKRKGLVPYVGSWK